MTQAKICIIDGTIRLPNFLLNINQENCHASLLENGDIKIVLMDRYEPYARSIIKNDLTALVHIGAKAFECTDIKSGNYGLKAKGNEITIHTGDAS